MRALGNLLRYLPSTSLGESGVVAVEFLRLLYVIFDVSRTLVCACAVDGAQFTPTVVERGVSALVKNITSGAMKVRACRALCDNLCRWLSASVRLLLLC